MAQALGWLAQQASALTLRAWSESAPGTFPDATLTARPLCHSSPTHRPPPLSQVLLLGLSPAFGVWSGPGRAQHLGPGENRNAEAMAPRQLTPAPMPARGQLGSQVHTSPPCMCSVKAQVTAPSGCRPQPSGLLPSRARVWFPVWAVHCLVLSLHRACWLHRYTEATLRGWPRACWLHWGDTPGSGRGATHSTNLCRPAQWT